MNVHALYWNHKSEPPTNCGLDALTLMSPNGSSFRAVILLLSLECESGRNPSRKNEWGQWLL
ncbi:MAG: hypothetical protein KDK23_13495 [Leptospiraceae bacterium]|nr:hypothetical protein [Leptospiraceae bacterium]